MSYFSILDFLKSGKKSLEDKNYYSALSVALSLPSMCSRIVYKDKAAYCSRDERGKLYWRDRKSYVDFCNAILSGDAWLSQCFGNSVGDVLYNLRCDIIHAGCADIYAGDYAVFLSYGPDCMSTEFSTGANGVKYKIVSIEGICNSIFDTIGARFFASCGKAGEFECGRTRVFGDTHDDVLLYNELCNRGRVSHLVSDFFEELDERSS